MGRAVGDGGYGKMIKMKICTKCGAELPATEEYFYKQPGNKDGLRGYCKKCKQSQKAEWQKKNKDKAKIYQLRFLDKHPNIKYNKYCNKLKKQVMDIYRGWHLSWLKERRREKIRNYRRDNLGKVREDARRYYKKKLLCCPRANINNRMRCDIWHAIKLKKNGRKWEELVGYSLDDLMRHLQKHFTHGMSWDNMGEWHIDHVIPQSAFNYSSPENLDFKKCWALKNLRPMWATDNIAKGSKLSKPFQPSLRLTFY